MDNPRLAYLRDKVKKLPLQPGIYIMKDKKGQQGQGAQKQGEQLLSQRGKAHAQGLPHGGERLGLRVHRHLQRV